MKLNTYQLKLIFSTTVLGTQPQKDVATEYITSKANRLKESLAIVEEVAAKNRVEL